MPMNRHAAAIWRGAAGHKFRLNRRTSLSRGMLFYRLVEQAVVASRWPYRQIAKGKHNMYGLLALSGYPHLLIY